jgi:hypothetical protein
MRSIIAAAAAVTKRPVKGDTVRLLPNEFFARNQELRGVVEYAFTNYYIVDCGLSGCWAATFDELIVDNTGTGV